MKNNDHDLNKPFQTKGYKKKFLVREIQTKEAEKELKQYHQLDLFDEPDEDDTILPKVD